MIQSFTQFINESGHHIDLESIYRFPEYMKLLNAGFEFLFNFDDKLEYNQAMEVVLRSKNFKTLEDRGMAAKAKKYPDLEILDFSLSDSGLVWFHMRFAPNDILKTTRVGDVFGKDKDKTNQLLNLNHIHHALKLIYARVLKELNFLNRVGCHIDTSGNEDFENARIDGYTSNQIKDLW